jgi:hypothetical protein
MAVPVMDLMVSNRINTATEMLGRLTLPASYPLTFCEPRIFSHARLLQLGQERLIC